MSMNAILKIFLLLAIPAISDAQTNTIDSLKRLLRSEQPDTARVLLLNQLSLAYRLTKPDTALAMIQQALSLSKRAGYVPGEVKSLSGIASIFRITGNYPKALQLHLEALKKAEAIPDERTASTVLLSIAIDYEYLGDYRQAVNYTLKVLAIGKRLHEEARINTSSLNLGNEYEKLNMLDSALLYTKQAYDLSVKLNNLDFTGVALNNFGNIYSKMGKDATAMKNYRLSLPYTIMEEDDDALCESYLGMASLFRKAGQADSCLYYAKLSLATAQKASFISRVMDASNFLTSYYISINNIDSAFVYQSATIAAKDSLFSQEKIREIQSLRYDETLRQQQIQDAKEEAQTQLKFNMLFGGLGALLLVAFLLIRNNWQRRKANILLKHQKEKVESTLQELKATQAQLVHSEKMASLGELTAGIAHEIQNPLNFVNNFSEVSNEMIAEMKNELTKNNKEDALAIADDIKQNLDKINYHGKRADAIVKGMLHHSRKSTGVKEPTNINALCDEYLRLSYHGLRAKDKSFNAIMKTDFDESIGKINIVPQDIGRVILNLINNAFYAVDEKKKKIGNDYEPTVSVTTKKNNGKVEIKVIDNGNGIPPKVLDKIFQPFFTTKPTGQGTGLGLSLSYDIVKAHGGELIVETKEGEGTEFIIKLSV